MTERPTAEAFDDVLVLRPAAEHLKLEAAMAIADTLAEPRFATARKVCVVLNQVKYVDSTAISLLVRIGAERTLRLAELSTRVRRVLETMDLIQLFDVDATEEDALAAFAADDAQAAGDT